MKIEIEKKFLLKNNSWRNNNIKGTLYKQAYLSTKKDFTLRIRIVEEKAFMTIKGKNNKGEAPEYEYPLNISDAKDIIKLFSQGLIIEKIRYKINYKGFLWEIDEFLGVNKGLILAEIELQKKDENFLRPPWLGKEVTGEIKYFNSNLSLKPYQKWFKNRIKGFLNEFRK